MEVHKAQQHPYEHHCQELGSSARHGASVLVSSGTLHGLPLLLLPILLQPEAVQQPCREVLQGVCAGLPQQKPWQG